MNRVLIIIITLLALLISVRIYREQFQDVTDYNLNNLVRTSPSAVPGSRGAKGDTGPRGDIGRTGPQGNKGDTGARGPAGEVGPKGPEGPRGQDGARGPKGDTGPAGPQGPKGPQGLRGPAGPAGKSSEITTELCLGTADNRVCITKDKLQSLLRTGMAPKNYMYYPRTHPKYPPIIYQNPFDALVTGSSTPVKKMRIKGSGFSSGWDITYYKNRLWYGRYMFHVGNGGNKYNGLEVNIPQIGTESMTLWLRFTNDRWAGVQLLKENGENIGICSSGRRNLNHISPDGAAPERWRQHSWMPISVPKGGKYVITNPKNRDSWISGVAFSANPWNHASLSALTVHWGENGGAKAEWDSDGWHYDPLGRFNNNKNYIGIKWPCEPSNYDKIIYIIEHNSDWLGTMHGRVAVNGVEVDRFSTAFDNPFARHINSKMYSRFMGLVVPKNIINSKRWLDVDISMKGANHNIYFREIGSFDYIP